jgi:hypothetical protein
LPITKLKKTIIEAAITGFDAQKKAIDAQIAELRAMLNGTQKGLAEVAPAKPKRRKFSREAIERMRKAQQERWAKIKGESETPALAPKPKRKLSTAAKAKLIANLRKARAAKAAKAAATKRGARKKSA